MVFFVRIIRVRGVRFRMVRGEIVFRGDHVARGYDLARCLRRRRCVRGSDLWDSVLGVVIWGRVFDWAGILGVLLGVLDFLSFRRESTW